MKAYLFSFILIFISFSVFSADPEPKKKDEKAFSCPDAPSTTHHSATISGVEVKYSVTAAYLKIKSPDEKSEACIFYTAYTEETPSDPAERPITFAFNGGPGSSSVWLHLGALGPKRVDLGSEGMKIRNPFRLVNNEFSILDISDLVMIDPVATGFSHADTKENTDKFFGVKNDYKSIGEFIRNFITNSNRWASPKFVMGESYGGVRGALLTEYLESDLGININGLVLVSPFLTTGSIAVGDPGNDLPYALFLPSFAAAAWYHHKLPVELQKQSLAEVVKEAEDFANNIYIPILLKGEGTDRDTYSRAVETLSRYSGISSDVVNEQDLRISDGFFFSNLLHKERLKVGRFDGRFTGAMMEDASSAAFGPQFTSAINDYLARELKFQSENPYQILKSVDNWPFDSDGHEFSAMDALSDAMLRNPDLKVYVASGYYDLAVPFSATKFNFNHLVSHQRLLDRVQFGFFEAGHMFYIKVDALKKFKDDMKDFFRINRE